VPYLGRERLPNGVRAYPCREVHGMIFVFPGDATLADERPLPVLTSAEDKKVFKTRRFGREVKCHYSFMHENLMDMNHQFLHRRQMGQMRARSVGRRRGENWIEVDYTFMRMAGKQPAGEALVFGASKKGTDQGGRSVMTIRTEYPHQTLRILSSEGALVMDLWIAYVPLDAAQRTNRTFGMLSVRKPGVPFVLDAAWPLLIWFTERIFKEDRMIVELEQAAHDSQGADWNHEVFPVINELRELLRNCAFEAGVEQLRGVGQARAVGERELDLAFVGVAHCDHAVAIPHGAAHVFPLLDDLRVGVEDGFAHGGKSLAAPVGEFRDQLVDSFRWIHGRSVPCVGRVM
jgi:phenylpropionate dioxygenase-like ring-hydroxylating dioxygenase large terminal subunit